MKIAVFSDIHGNIDAFKNVMDEALKLNIKKFICLGDYVGYYYNPEKCLDLLLNKNVEFIKGNHENIFIDLINNPKNLNKYISVYGNGIKHALNNLSEKQVEFIKNMPEKKELIIDGLNILIAHGSPWDINFYIYPNVEKNYLDKLSSYKQDFIFLGHTHIQMEKKLESTVILNPGSIGQPRDKDGLAKWLVFDTKTKKVEFKKTDFNKKNLMEQIFINDPNKNSLIKYFK